MPSDSFRNCVKVGGRPCSATIAATVDGMSVVRRAAYTTPWTRARVRRAQASVFLSDACAHASDRAPCVRHPHTRKVLQQRKFEVTLR